MSGLPVINNINARQIFRDNGLILSAAEGLIWSTDATTLIASLSSKLYYQLETDRLNLSPLTISTHDLDLLTKPKPGLNGRIYSPDETKYLYVATASGSLPKVLTTYLPGTNPTSEVRNLIAGKTYVYDIKEDRNYLLPDGKYLWFPTSRHLVSYTKNEIAVLEYDGANKAIVYTGPFVDGYVFVWPNWSKIVILTSLNQPSQNSENLYTINLR